MLTLSSLISLARLLERSSAVTYWLTSPLGVVGGECQGRT
jgi:hypothetical protein